MTAHRLPRVLLSWLLVLVIFSAPLPVHRYLLERPYNTLYFEFTAFIIYLSDIYAALFILATAITLIAKHLKLHFGLPGLTVPLLLLPIAALLSVHWATDPALAAHFATRLLLLFFLYLAIINAPISTIIVQAGLAIVVVVQGLTAVLQFWQQHHLGLAWLGEIPIEPVSGLSILVVNGRIWLRAFGLTPHPNILGGYLAAFLLIVATRFLETNGRARWLWAGTAVLGLGGLLLSFSRSAWVGLFIAGLILLIYLMGQAETRQRYLRLIMPLTIIGLVALVAFAWTQRDLLFSRLQRPDNVQETRSMSERQTLNQIAFRIIQEHPWRGVGAGQISYHMDNYTDEYPSVAPQPVHNMPILLTAEFGILGGLLWLWLTLYPLVITAQLWRQGQRSLWTLSLALALLVLAITDFFDFYSWGWQQGRMLRWLLFGLWAQAVYDPQNRQIG